MRIIKGLCLAIVCVTALTACASNNTSHESYSVDGKAAMQSPNQERLIIRSAGLDITVGDIKDATDQVTKIVEGNNGHIQSSRSYDAKRLHMTVRIPQQKLDSSLQQLREIGEVTSEQMSSNDVTDNVMDMDARLKNLKNLRTRFRALLEKADTVEDILSIEKELARIQTDIDLIENRRKSVIGDIEHSNVEISLKQKRILGPLGYIGKGFFWVVGKLFVIK